MNTKTAKFSDTKTEKTDLEKNQNRKLENPNTPLT